MSSRWRNPIPITPDPGEKLKRSYERLLWLEGAQRLVETGRFRNVINSVSASCKGYPFKNRKSAYNETRNIQKWLREVKDEADSASEASVRIHNELREAFREALRESSMKSRKRAR